VAADFILLYVEVVVFVSAVEVGLFISGFVHLKESF
jgi:hypothetical protein